MSNAVFLRDTVMPHGHSCPACQTKLDVTTGAHGGPARDPIPGDVTLCCSCGKILAFTDTMQLRLATEEEIAKMSPFALKIIKAMQERIAKKRNA